MDEDVQLFACVVGFPDGPLLYHEVAVSQRDSILRIVHVKMLQGCRHDILIQFILPEEEQQENHHH